MGGELKGRMRDWEKIAALHAQTALISPFFSNFRVSSLASFIVAIYIARGCAADTSADL